MAVIVPVEEFLYYILALYSPADTEKHIADLIQYKYPLVNVITRSFVEVSLKYEIRLPFYFL